MTRELIKNLEDYRSNNDLTYAQLAMELEVPENYLYRWRKNGRITGVYAKIITTFLDGNNK